MPRCKRCDRIYDGTKYSRVCDNCLDPKYHGGKDRTPPNYTKGGGRRVKKPMSNWRKIDG